MTKADELRKMLDERGVEYTQTIVTEGTLFLVITSDEHYFILVRDNDAGIEMWSQYLTPAQAIVATLGVGTCHNVHEPPKDTTFWPSPHFKCSECGATHVSMEYVFHCPNCGRKVVDE